MSRSRLRVLNCDGSSTTPRPLLHRITCYQNPRASLLFKLRSSEFKIITIWRRKKLKRTKRSWNCGFACMGLWSLKNKHLMISLINKSFYDPCVRQLTPLLWLAGCFHDPWKAEECLDHIYGVIEATYSTSWWANPHLIAKRRKKKANSPHILIQWDQWRLLLVSWSEGGHTWVHWGRTLDVD